MLTRRFVCMALATILPARAAMAPNAALAHGLPGSTIMLTLHPARIDIALSLPLDELALAMGAGLPISNGKVPAPWADSIASYLAAHITLHIAGTPAPLVPAPHSLTVSTATQEHVGAYPLLHARFTAAAPPSAPLTLFYDAVLHQVRNHRAVVLVATPDGAPLAMGEIRANPDGGPPLPFVLNALP